MSKMAKASTKVCVPGKRCAPLTKVRTPHKVRTPRKVRSLHHLPPQSLNAYQKEDCRQTG